VTTKINFFFDRRVSKVNNGDTGTYMGIDLSRYKFILASFYLIKAGYRVNIYTRGYMFGLGL